MSADERSWGVTPVPDRLRTLGVLDVGLLWGNLGISLLVLVTGAFLVPGLGLAAAVGAILVGSAIGCAMLGVAGAIGTERRLPGMVLYRDPLGARGSFLPTGLNVAQNLGWATFELIVIAEAAHAVARNVFDVDARWLWVLVAAALAIGLALAGPVSFVRKFVRKFAIWIVVVSLGYLTWWTLDGADLGALWSQSGDGSTSFMSGVDLTIAMAASWFPLAADYTRFARSTRRSFWGTAIGYFVPLVLLFGLGALLALGRELTTPTEIIAAVATSGAAGALALIALAVDEADEPFANVYSAALSIQNVLPWAPQKVLIGLVGGIATLLALVVDFARYESFLFLLGSFFVPLFGVLVADFLLGSARATAWRGSGIAAWLAGFCLYQWLQPTGPQWWLDLIDGTNAGAITIGASLPAFGAAFALYAALRVAVPHRAAVEDG